jgi:hypothetical protein
LTAVFVDPFPDSERRPYLLMRFQLLLDQLVELGIAFEVWIDGSFSTLKQDPDDIDLAVFFNPDQVDSLDSNKKQVLNDIFGSGNRQVTKLRYGCDAYFVEDNNPAMRSYWRGWFGFDRSESAKGIARMSRVTQ